MSRSPPQQIVNAKCSLEDWLQWEKLRPSATPDCAQKVQLLCNGPWTDWVMVPGEDCYSERYRHILYKSGRRARLTLCDEEVEERGCDDVPISTDTPSRLKQATIPDKHVIGQATQDPVQTHRPTDMPRTTQAQRSTTVGGVTLTKQVPGTRAGQVSDLHSDTNMRNSLVGGAVAGICLGVVFLIILIAVIVLIVIRRRQNSRPDYYSDPDVGDMNSSSRGNTYQEISSLDSTRSYEKNICFNSSKFPNDKSHLQSTDNHQYDHLRFHPSHRSNMPDHKLSNRAYDHTDEPNLYLGDSKVDAKSIANNSTLVTDGGQNVEPCPNQKIHNDMTVREVIGNVSASGKSVTEDVSMDGRTYYILEPEIEDGDQAHHYDDNDDCSLVNKADSDNPTYDVPRRVNTSVH